MDTYQSFPVTIHGEEYDEEEYEFEEDDEEEEAEDASDD